MSEEVGSAEAVKAFERAGWGAKAETYGLLTGRITAREGMLGGSVRSAGLVMRQPPRTQRRIRAEAERLAEEYRVDGGLAIPACAKIARGSAP